MNFTVKGQVYTIPDPSRSALEFLLMEIRFTRLKSRMYNWLSTGLRPTPAEFQAKLDELDSKFEFQVEDSAIDTETREIAAGLIRAKLAEKSLPTPRQTVMDLHITQLIAANPAITERARQVVEARETVSSEILEALE